MKYVAFALSLMLLLAAGCASPKSVAKKDFFNGLTALDHGSLDKAEKDFQDAVRLDPANYNAHYYLAQVYERKKEYDKAAGMYGEAIKLDGKNYRAYDGLVGMYLDTGKPLEAAKAGEEGIAGGVPKEVLATDVGWSYYVANDLDRAEEWFKAARELIKNDTAPTNDLGLVYFCKGRYAEALALFEEAGRLNPKSQVVPYLMALTYNKLGDTDKTVEALRTAMCRDPKLESKLAATNREFFPNTDPGYIKPLIIKIRGSKCPK